MFHSPLYQLDACSVRVSFIFVYSISMRWSGFSVCYSILRDDPLCSESKRLFGSLVVD